MSPQMKAVDRLMQAGVAQHVFPGAVLAVARGDNLIFEQAYGQADLFSNRPMRRETCFDLASLTKPLATVLAVMDLVRRGRLDLDQPCGDHCPPLMGSDKSSITIRQLLQHRSGLPPWRPFFMRLRHVSFARRRTALQLFLGQTPLVAPPGQCADYSDLGYMVLLWVVEAVGKTDLASMVRDVVYAPLGIGDLFFNDTRQTAPTPDRFAATQFCPWRHKLMLGHVDDDNAFVTGGIAGHAGLFGTATAVTRLLQALLAADRGEDGQGNFDPRLVRQFLEAKAGDRWTLGFDTPSAQGSSAGRYFEQDSVGHLGFTGTSFWVHRQKRVVVVLLTNRVHPWRFNDGIKAFRPDLHDTVMEAVA